MKNYIGDNLIRKNNAELDTQNIYIHNLDGLESCRKGQCHSWALRYCKVMIKRMISRAEKLTVTDQETPK
jgi:hypothetical protein